MEDFCREGEKAKIKKNDIYIRLIGFPAIFVLLKAEGKMPTQ